MDTELLKVVFSVAGLCILAILVIMMGLLILRGFSRDVRDDFREVAGCGWDILLFVVDLALMWIVLNFLFSIQP
jgi:hypothetical protein